MLVQQDLTYDWPTLRISGRSYLNIIIRRHFHSLQLATVPTDGPAPPPTVLPGNSASVHWLLCTLSGPFDLKFTELHDILEVLTVT